MHEKDQGKSAPIIRSSHVGWGFWTQYMTTIKKGKLTRT
jgi:hypothetical protein